MVKLAKPKLIHPFFQWLEDENPIFFWIFSEANCCPKCIGLVWFFFTFYFFFGQNIEASKWWLVKTSNRSYGKPPQLPTGEGGLGI